MAGVGQQSALGAAPRPAAPASPFPRLPPELAERIGAFVPPNDRACAFRLTCRAAAATFSGPRHTTLHLSQPGIPHDIFERKWAAPGACHALSYRQRRQLTRLTAASGDVANLQTALAAAGLVPGAAELGAAAAAGRLQVCTWLRRRHNVCMADPTGDALVAAAAAGCADGAAWLLSKGASWSWAAVGAAAAGGHVALVDWLMAARPAALAAQRACAAAAAAAAAYGGGGGPAVGGTWAGAGAAGAAAPEPLQLFSALAAVAEGCELAVLQRCFGAWTALLVAGLNRGDSALGAAAATATAGGGGGAAARQHGSPVAAVVVAHTGSGEAAAAEGGELAGRRQAALVTRGQATLAAAAAQAAAERHRGPLLAAAARSSTPDWREKVTWLLGLPAGPEFSLEEAGGMAFAGAAEVNGGGGGGSSPSGRHGADGSGGCAGGSDGGDGGAEAAARMAWLAALGLVPDASALLAAVRCRAAAAVELLLAAPPPATATGLAAAAAAWPPLPVGEEVVMAAAEVGDVRLLRRLLSDPRCEAADALDALCAAAGAQQLLVLEFLTGHGREAEGGADEAEAGAGAGEALYGQRQEEEEEEEEKEEEEEETDAQEADAAGDGGSREQRRRRWRRRLGLQLCGAALDDPLIANEAAQAGSLEVLRWLAARRCPMDEFTMAGAAEGGCVAALEWLAGQQRVPLGASGDAWRQASWGDLATLRALAALRVPLGPAGAGPAGAAATFLGMLVRGGAPLPALQLMVDEARCPVDWEKARRGALRRRDESRRPLLEWVRQQAAAASGGEGGEGAEGTAGGSGLSRGGVVGCRKAAGAGAGAGPGMGLARQGREGGAADEADPDGGEEL
ncbi:hypothetical protein HYH02_011082 [Chlamydomonas schloesseri]|uniref:F-box domain-containing protein n=1 Tax=Chlamydomonas schloesseri TaxID=2026947 RepID=A0A835TC82_9CHLO|nr:hypothetical protein HYH02_011082 [Chlamydomonas schloesseri]|eukprot:KAG2437704.1 hypothetical protein HYH02_011082 [Chlamydomonas schloesseri]